MGLKKQLDIRCHFNGTGFIMNWRKEVGSVGGTD